MRQVLSTIVTFVFMTMSGIAAAGDNPFLWRIEGDKPSYLFGTIHVSDPRATVLPSAVEQAFQNSDAVYTEIPMDLQTQFAAAQGMVLPAGNSLTSILPADLVVRTERYLGVLIPGMSLDALGQLKVWAIAMTLPLLESQLKNIGAEALDMALYNRAAQAGKEVGGLETAEEQIAIMDNLSLEVQQKLLADTLDYLEKARGKGIDVVDEMVVEYLKGDLDSLGRLMTKYLDINDPFYDNLMDSLLTARNHLMADRIDAMLNSSADKSYFVAVGAGHFWGDEGVHHLLRGKGYNVTRVQ